MAIAAVVLADEVPAAADWWDYGVREVDDVLGYMLVTGDGAYGEGPYYYRYTMQNLAAPDRGVGAPPRLGLLGRPTASWSRRPLPRSLLRPHAALDARHDRCPTAPWRRSTTATPGRSYYWGATADRPAGHRPPATGAGPTRPSPSRPTAPSTVGADTIVAYDDTVTPAPADWSARRSSTSRAATPSSGRTGRRTRCVASCSASTTPRPEFGRDRTGTGRRPQSHEHADPGSFLLNAFGERLALDPGYLTFPTRTQVNKPEHHNTVLVDGAGPADYLQASLQWLTDPQGRPPAEGQATISATLDTPSLDAATVVHRLPGHRAGPTVLVRRRPVPAWWPTTSTARRATTR